jgi:sugar lactone lactonase YvrE
MYLRSHIFGLMLDKIRLNRSSTLIVVTLLITVLISSTNSRPLAQEGIQAPHGIAIDSNDNMYLTDVNNLVQKFDSNGELVIAFGSSGSGDGEFNDPHGIVVDPSENIYVVDTWNARVQKFDSNGNFIMKWGSEGGDDGQFQHPHDVAVDSHGNVYVGDYWNSNVQKFDSNGNFIMKWGANGTADGQFLNKGDQEGVEGIDVDSSDNVYVADSGNARVQKFDSNGNFIMKWGSEGTSNGHFDYLSGLAIDSDNNVYVSDEGLKNIQKFDSNGNFIMKWGSAGDEEDELDHIHYIDVDSSGNIYVADPADAYESDNNNGFIQKFDSNGNFVVKLID